MVDRRRRRVLAGLLLLGYATLGYTTLAHSADTDFENVSVQPLEPALAEAGWLLLARNDVAATQFSAHRESVPGNNQPVNDQPINDQPETAPPVLLRIDANNSNALMYRKLTAAEQNATHLRWSWRVDQAPPVTSLRRVDGEDRPLAVYVGFEVKRKHLGLWTRLKRSIVSRVSGLPSGQIVTYVWGGDDPRGSHFDNPYIPRISRMKILRDGQQPLATWFEEEIDLFKDFAEVFDYPAVRPTFIAVSADSEDSQTYSLGWIKSLRFETADPRLDQP